MAPNSNDVTTPKLPPPPRSAQSRSGSPSGPATTRSPAAVTSSARTQVVAGEPAPAPDSQPIPPPRVRPPTPVSPNVPPTTARWCAQAAASTSSHCAPPWHADDPGRRVDRDRAHVAQVHHERAVGHARGRRRCARRHGPRSGARGRRRRRPPPRRRPPSGPGRSTAGRRCDRRVERRRASSIARVVGRGHPIPSVARRRSMTNPSTSHLVFELVVAETSDLQGTGLHFRGAPAHPGPREREPIITCESPDSSARPNRRSSSRSDPGAPSPCRILPTIQDAADLRGLDEIQLAQLAVEIRDTIVQTVAITGRPPRVVARRRRADDRAAPAARVAARSHRLGHRTPGLPAQAADRSARAVRDAAPARWRRRLPATLRVAARRVRRRPCRDRPVDRRRPGRGARPAPRARADRRRRR